MTTTVKRGAGRPAAQAKTSRHAQRTPLPPKQRDVETAREAIEEVTSGICPKEGCHRLPDHKGRHGEPTRAEVVQIQAMQDEQVAAEFTPMTEPELGFQQEIDAASVEPNKIDNPMQTELQPTAEKPGDTKSWGKAMAFRGSVTALGWSATAGNVPDGVDDDIVEVIAQRGDEHLWISWTKGAMTLEPMPTYTISDRTVKLKNASACLKYAARPVDVAANELSKVVSNKAFRRKVVEPKKAPLPFDPNLASDEEVVSALLGKAVAWHNSISQMTESAVLGRDASRVTVIEIEGGDRIVKFCCPSTGFRAFKLSALQKVGGGRKTPVRLQGGRIDIEELPEES